MLFEQRFGAGIADGSITLTYRCWRRAQVVAGRRYRTPIGRIDVDSAEIVDPSTISEADARRAGYPDRAQLLADLRGTADVAIHRIQFRAVHDADERDVLGATTDLSADDVAELDRRLDRFDRAGSNGPWTAATLDVIARHPERRAGDLAAELGRERDALKVDVRKLKNLGLTLSLEVGYRLSPRGEAYRRRTGRR